MSEATTGSKSSWLRGAVLVLGGLETVLLGFVAFLALSQVLSSNEQLGRSIGWALAAAVVAPLLLLALPALVLGILGRRLKLALVLAIVGLAVPLAMRFLT